MLRTRLSALLVSALLMCAMAAPAGAAPYQVVSFTPGVEQVMEAFDGYWRKTPSIKRLVFRSITEETTRAAALKKGDVDIAYLLSGPVADGVRKSPGIKLVGAKPPGVFWIDLPEQWDPKSPWHDQRVRQAASLAIDRKAINQAETLGFSLPTGSIIPRSFEFALAFEPPAYDPGKAKKLLADAGYPNGFDAGDFYPWLPYDSMGEAYVSKGGIYTTGVIPEVEGLFQRQGRERDRAKRETMLQRIQQILHHRVIQIPIYEPAFLWRVEARVEEAGVDQIKGFAYSGPYEDLRLKRQP